MGVRLQQMKLDGRAGNHHSVYSTFLIGLRYWPFLFYFISNSLLKELNDTGWALVCWAWYPKDYLFIYSLFILGLLSKKNMMPSGNLRLSQETLTRTHHSTGYKKQGHLPSGCSRCPSCSNCSHNCGTCPHGSSFHSSVSLSSPPSQILLLGTQLSHQLALAFRYLSRSKKAASLS